MSMPKEQSNHESCGYPGIKDDDRRYRPVTSLIAELELCRPVSAFQYRSVELSTAFRKVHSLLN